MDLASSTATTQANQLTAEKFFDASGRVVGISIYEYDDAGTMVRQRGMTGDADFVFNAKNQLVQGAGKAYNYDAAGNMVSVTDATGTTRHRLGCVGPAKSTETPTGDPNLSN